MVNLMHDVTHATSTIGFVLQHVLKPIPATISITPDYERRAYEIVINPYDSIYTSGEVDIPFSRINEYDIVEIIREAGLAALLKEEERELIVSSELDEFLNQLIITESEECLC